VSSTFPPFPSTLHLFCSVLSSFSSKYCPVLIHFFLHVPNCFIMKSKSSEILHLCEKFVVTFLPKRRIKLIILHAVKSCNIYCESLKTCLIAVLAYSRIDS
jgi:hypothetical protein